jgi:hypothetical protein
MIQLPLEPEDTIIRHETSNRGCLLNTSDEGLLREPENSNETVVEPERA